ncbi:GMC oxidoreductase-like protein [Boeremia exigua]|uniref:GMC oxidoreductase-like protein n=1 Tax=Boeremia exigua TaxID=749465 RepID=UPI001E8E1890|nr:GMC oxidoreductase-like protein [Boeremia exigua]KAH6629698.1 GMC oxidoreductase-like protein [Boeremia exigua]
MLSLKLGVLTLLATANGAPTRWRSAMVRRTVADLAGEYDYIVVGAGTAGTTLGDRLSEDGNKTVLMIEYGSLALDDSFMPPWNVPSSEFLYNINSVPQTYVNNRTFPVINGRVVGGASAVNGQLHTRGSKHDYDNIAKFAGNEDWNWDSLYPYFKKSVTFHEPTDEMKEFGITYDLDAWGNSTPIHAAFPPYQYPGQRVQWQGWAEREGIEVQKEHANGNAYGVCWVPTAMNPDTGYNRSFAGIGHWLEVPRPNFHLLTEHRGVKVNFEEVDGLQQAVSVVVAPRYGNDTTFVLKARKEVILSSSAVRTPQILQLSGIGRKVDLEAAGVEVLIDLPGVGWNLQDHSFSVSMYNFTKDLWPHPSQMTTNATFRAEALAEYKANNSGPYAAYVVSSALFLPGPTFLGNYTSTLADSLAAQDPGAHLPSDTPPELIAGYAAQKEILHASLLSNTSAILEHPFQGLPRGTTILLKPLSRGTIKLNTSDPFGPPVVDYRLLSNPLDLQLHIRMQQYLRAHFATSRVLAPLGPVELDPGPSLPSDEDVASWLIGQEKLFASNAHQVGTTAMAPKELGGVVDGRLRVYGTRGLRVVDCGVLGVLVGAHTMAAAYMVGEKAADLIKQDAVL